VAAFRLSPCIIPAGIVGERVVNGQRVGRCAKRLVTPVFRHYRESSPDHDIFDCILADYGLLEHVILHPPYTVLRGSHLDRVEVIVNNPINDGLFLLRRQFEAFYKISEAIQHN
jgi:hypothetical protein